MDLIDYLHATNPRLATALTMERLAFARHIVELNTAIRLVLRWHSGAPWTDEDRKHWTETTGHEDATSRVLCDYLRSKLEPEAAGALAQEERDAMEGGGA